MKPISFSPDGWEKVSLGYERGQLPYVGVIRSFNAPAFSYVKDAADIIRFIVTTTNTEQEIYLILQKFFSEVTDVDFSPVHKTVYKGLFDLNTYQDKRPKVEVNIGEPGIAKVFNTIKDDLCEVELYKDHEAVFLRHDGMALSETHNWIIAKDETASGGVHIVGTYFITKEGKAPGFASFSVPKKNLGVDPLDMDTSSDYVFATSQVITGMRIKGTITLRNGSGPLKLKSNKGKNITLVNLATGAPDTKTDSFDTTFDAEEGEKFFLIVEGGDGGFMYYQESTFTVSFFSQYKTTYVRCYTPFTFLRRLLLTRLGRESDVQYSELLEANKGKLLTSGDSLRGMPNATIKSSLTSFFKSMHVILGACTGIEHNKLVSAAYEHFYNFTGTAVSLGEVSKFVNDYAEELTGSAVNIGYSEKIYNDVNGRKESNNTNYYTTPSSVDRTIDFISPYRADPYGAELTRINNEGKTTTDSGGDNDIFVLDSKPDAISFTANIYADSFGAVNFVADIYADNFDGQHIIFVTGNDPGALSINDGAALTLSGTVNNNRTFSVITTQAVSGGVNVHVKEVLTPESANGVTFTVPPKQFIFVSGNYQEATAFIPGMRFTLSGTDSNNSTFTVNAVALAGGGVNLYVNEPLTTELKDGVTISVNNVWSLKRDAVVLEGVPSPSTIFNVELSPANLLRLHMKYINSIMYGFQGQKLKFQTTDKNHDLKYTINGVTIKEDADVLIGTDRLFINYFFGFDTLVPVSLYETLESVPDAHFTLTTRGIPLKGLLYKAGISLSDNKEQSYSLLCSPEVDLKTLL